MLGIADSGGPSYISAHSADLILSDIRPIKLKIEALRSINVLLDEFLYSILNTACSLSTDKLRASLLSLLPTTLGKEALLEAEVELRTYWDRTGPPDVAVLEDDGKTFQLQWAFEFLRLKCEAYSTLNETDEDPEAENRINEKMHMGGGFPPKATLMAPAALYLTAILEAMCEHILSNVGRVASRDSSRSAATANDLFVALCEDHSIYGFFKTMKVYEQIEQLCKGPKSQRRKSFSRNDKHLDMSSTYQDVPIPKDGTPTRSRFSSESGMSTTLGSTPASIQVTRSSFEKGRAMKMFMANSRSSIDRDWDSHQISHKKSDSFLSENSRQTSVLEPTTVEDEAMQKEFDDLMRSSATMRVSLTPDRLKTMEVYQQEKDQRSNRLPVSLALNSESDLSVVPPRGSPRRSTLLPVESIKEDDEETSLKPSRARQGSVSNPAKSSSSRVRAVSTSGVTPRTLMKFSRITSPPVSMHFNTSGPVKMQDNHKGTAKGQGYDPLPPRTRTVQQNRESIDLDDVMGESDDENATPPPPSTKQMNAVTSPSRPKHAVSAGTRDLMDFLAQGPPDVGSQDVSDLFLEGSHPGELGKSKGSRRLQKMISKLSLGGGDKSRGSHDDLSKTKVPQSSSRNHQSPIANPSSSLANRPIPPRPPYHMSPPSPSLDSSEQQSYIGSRSRSASVGQKKQDLSEAHRSEPSPPVPSPTTSHGDRGEQPLSSQQPSIFTGINGHSKHVVLEEPLKHTTSPPMNTVVNGNVSAIHDSSQNRTSRLSPASPTKIQVRKPAPVYDGIPNNPHVSYEDARDMYRLLSRATSADECRLIFDMFLAKSGIKVESADNHGSPPSAAAVQITPADAPLEHSLVELLLGGTDPASASSRVHKQLHRVVKETIDEDSSVAKSELTGPMVSPELALPHN